MLLNILQAVHQNYKRHGNVYFSRFVCVTLAPGPCDTDCRDLGKFPMSDCRITSLASKAKLLYILRCNQDGQCHWNWCVSSLRRGHANWIEATLYKYINVHTHVIQIRYHDFRWCKLNCRSSRSCDAIKMAPKRFANTNRVDLTSEERQEK